MNHKPALPLPDSVAQTLTASLLQNLLRDGVALSDDVRRGIADTLPRLVDAVLAQRLRPMSTAPRGGRDHRILARVRADHDRVGLAGRWFDIWHQGYLEPDSDAPYDLGWALYPGHGGVPDIAFDGWLPLPITSPAAATGLSEIKGDTSMSKKTYDPDAYELKFEGLKLELPAEGDDDGKRYRFTLTRKLDGATWTGNYGRRAAHGDDDTWFSLVKLYMADALEFDEATRTPTP